MSSPTPSKPVNPKPFLWNEVDWRAKPVRHGGFSYYIFQPVLNRPKGGKP